MKFVFYIFLIISIIVGVYRCSKYFNDDEYREDFSKKTESIYKSKVTTYKNIFKYVEYTFLVFLGTFVFITISFTRWKKIRVFISYNVENEKCAERIKNIINRYSIKADYLPYSNLDHNEIISKVSKMIKKSDAVVTIPGNRSESNFTDAEILAASTLQKTIVILVLNEKQRLPNTAYTGYPHFYYSSNSSMLSFNPLSYFLMVTFRHVKTIRAIVSRGIDFLKHSLIISGAILIVLMIILEVLKIFSAFISLKLSTYFFGIILFFLLTILFLYLIILISQQYKLTKIVNQSQISGDLTYNQLYSIFKNDKLRGNAVLNSLVKEALKKRY